MRLLLARDNGGGGLFVQGEWLDSAGNHTKRLTEDLPLLIFSDATNLLEWFEKLVTTDLAPKTETTKEIATIEQEIAKLTARLGVLKAR